METPKPQAPTNIEVKHNTEGHYVLSFEQTEASGCMGDIFSTELKKNVWAFDVKKPAEGKYEIDITKQMAEEGEEPLQPGEYIAIVQSYAETAGTDQVVSGLEERGMFWVEQKKAAKPGTPPEQTAAKTENVAPKPENGNGKQRDRRHITPPLQNTIGEKLPAELGGEGSAHAAGVKPSRPDIMIKPDGFVSIKVDDTTDRLEDTIQNSSGEELSRKGRSILKGNNGFFRRYIDTWFTAASLAKLNPEGEKIVFESVAVAKDGTRSDPGRLEYSLTREQIEKMAHFLVEREEMEARDAERESRQRQAAQNEKQAVQKQIDQLREQLKSAATKTEVRDLTGKLQALEEGVGGLRRDFGTVKETVGKLDQGMKDHQTTILAKMDDFLAKARGMAPASSPASDPKPSAEEPAYQRPKIRREASANPVFIWGLVVLVIVGFFLFFGTHALHQPWVTEKVIVSSAELAAGRSSSTTKPDGGDTGKSDAGPASDKGATKPTDTSGTRRLGGAKATVVEDGPDDTDSDVILLPRGTEKATPVLTTAKPAAPAPTQPERAAASNPVTVVQQPQPTIVIIRDHSDYGSMPVTYDWGCGSSWYYPLASFQFQLGGRNSQGCSSYSWQQQRLQQMQYQPEPIQWQWPTVFKPSQQVACGSTHGYYYLYK